MADFRQREEKLDEEVRQKSEMIRNLEKKLSLKANIENL